MIYSMTWMENDSHVCPCEFVTLWSGFSKIRLYCEVYHPNCIFHVLILHMLWLFFSFADMIKVKRILIGITKLVLSRKIIFSNPDLRNDLNGKLFHKFVSTNLLLYELLLVTSDTDCVVTVTIQLRIPCVHNYCCCDLVRIDSIPCAHFTHAVTFLFFIMLLFQTSHATPLKAPPKIPPPQWPQTTANIPSCPFRGLVGTFGGVWGVLESV